MGKISHREEKRRQWREEKKTNPRVTRASTTQSTPGKTKDTVKAAVPNSHTPSETKKKHSLANKAKTSPPSCAQHNNNNNNIIDKKFNDLHNNKKSKYGNTVKISKTEPDSSDEPPSKKQKLQYVDAVERLESSTSVHVPKKLVLVVGNLPEDVTKEQIMEHFKRTGGVKSVKIPKQKGTETGKGCAYVEFRNTISHRLGVRLHNTTLAGRKICVEFAPEGKLTERKLTETLQLKEETQDLKMPFDT
ncbi:YGR4-like protein [Mya arenaria]|uniref:YGR4-like protein n=1 Tax=Mya arenaria TaxID=6604 RepID=A0ABY7EBJ9_MYAAR|nr:uncharacterized protein LOC128234884 [Mya arenaria]WAR06083.1 YGR4-like protein [Mya arenaria]